MNKIYTSCGATAQIGPSQFHFWIL